MPRDRAISAPPSEAVLHAKRTQRQLQPRLQLPKQMTWIFLHFKDYLSILTSQPLHQIEVQFFEQGRKESVPPPQLGAPTPGWRGEHASRSATALFCPSTTGGRGAPLQGHTPPGKAFTKAQGVQVPALVKGKVKGLNLDPHSPGKHLGRKKSSSLGAVRLLTSSLGEPREVWPGLPLGSPVGHPQGTVPKGDLV